MAILEQCRNCGKSMSSDVSKCPHCEFVHHYCLACEQPIEYSHLCINGIIVNEKNEFKKPASAYYETNKNILGGLAILEGGGYGYFIKEYSTKKFVYPRELIKYSKYYNLLPHATQSYFSLKIQGSPLDDYGVEAYYYVAFHDVCYEVVNLDRKIKYSSKCELCGFEAVIEYTGNIRDFRRFVNDELDKDYDEPQEFAVQPHLACKNCGHPIPILKRKGNHSKRYSCIFCQHPVSLNEGVIIDYEGIEERRRVISHKVCYTSERKILVNKAHEISRELERKRLAHERLKHLEQERLKHNLEEARKQRRLEEAKKRTREGDKGVVGCMIAILVFLFLLAILLAST